MGREVFGPSLMPKLIQLLNLKWGDMIQTPDGGVFSVDSNGFLQLVYGPPYRVSKDSNWAGNEDGKENSCVPIAFKYLGLELPMDSPTHLQLDDILSRYEKIAPSGTVADFIRDHKEGRYFVSAYSDDVGHAFAVLEGVAHNLTYQSLSRGVRVAYRIR